MQGLGFKVGLSVSAFSKTNSRAGRLGFFGFSRDVQPNDRW